MRRGRETRPRDPRSNVAYRRGTRRAARFHATETSMIKHLARLRLLTLLGGALSRLF